MPELDNTFLEAQYLWNKKCSSSSMFSKINSLKTFEELEILKDEYFETLHIALKKVC